MGEAFTYVSEDGAMKPTVFFRMKGLTTVAGRTYSRKYSIASVSNFMAEQIANRDFASWKKAEHIVLSQLITDPIDQNRILSRWRMLTSAEPVGRSIQKLYIPIGYEHYVKYDAEGRRVADGSLEKLWDTIG